MLRRLARATLSITLLLANVVCAQERQPPADWLEQCTLDRIDAVAWCGKYALFEDRDAMSGRTIDLNVVVIAAESSNPEPDPVLPTLRVGPSSTGSRQPVAALAST